ncbi:hypothetical protein [Polluticoccus soli]|uniref:hypothetical protein n=1 Tax=Polluticoccus soli TaxID=3034150 RepID=UPI0023E32F8C|nr:hypothetical protein [Flavipsychrobacter sp. JY13-12]
MKRIILLALTLTITTIGAWAQAPQKFNYQGIARNASGAPLASQALGLRLTIIDGSPSGTTVYQETFTVTTNAYGLYNVQVGDGTVVSGTFNTIDWANGNKYIQVEADPTGGTTYANLGTSQLISAPYAVYANNAGTATMGGDVTGISTAANVTKIQGRNVSATAPTAGQALTWDAGTSSWIPLNTGVSGTLNYIPKFTSTTAIGNSQLFDNGTSVGIGTTSPTASNKLQVVNAASTPSQHAVHGISGAAASGSITINSALYGESSTGIGVAGVGQANDGVFGYSLSGTAAGVEGFNSAANGAGVLGSGDAAGSAGGRFTGGASGYGVIVTAGLSGFGVTAPAAMLHTSGSKDVTVTLGGINFNHQALLAQTSATTTTNVSSALVGFAGNSSFENHGVHAFVRGPGGASFNVGVFSSATAATTSTGNSYGVYGSAANGATNYGIYGTATGGTPYAGYFAGNVSVTGTMSKGGGTFKIDHPLDPENKYLYHSFVESPDMMNIYNGNIVTDAAGDAIVTLPDYFEALNRDFRYQLTVIGSFAQAIIYEKINNNQFKIKTDKPNIEVSWQITGVRHDKFADAHRVVPEVEKEPEFKGRYLHAAEWGKSESKSIDDATRPHGENVASTSAITPLSTPVPATADPSTKVANTGASNTK